VFLSLFLRCFLAHSKHFGFAKRALLVVQPLVLSWLLEEIEDPTNDSVLTGSCVAAALAGCSVLGTVFHNLHFLNTYRFGILARTSLLLKTFKTSMLLSNSSLAGISSGKIMVNIINSKHRATKTFGLYFLLEPNGGRKRCLAYDVYDVSLSVGGFLHGGIRMGNDPQVDRRCGFFYRVPHATCVPNAVSFGRIILFLLYASFNYFFTALKTRLVTKSRKRMLKFTDRRVTRTSEVLNGIRAIKFYSWEEAFGDQVFARGDFKIFPNKPFPS